VKIYLDVSCLNRPFDDQFQVRVRLEAEAVAIVLERMDRGIWVQASSEMAVIETDAITDTRRRAKVRLLLPTAKDILKLDDATWDPGRCPGKAGLQGSGRDSLSGGRTTRGGCVPELRRPALPPREAPADHYSRSASRMPVDWLKEVYDASNP